MSQSHPSVRVIALTTYAPELMSEAMHDAGAVAYIQKDAPIEKLIAAIRDAHTSGTEGVLGRGCPRPRLSLLVSTADL